MDAETVENIVCFLCVLLFLCNGCGCADWMRQKKIFQSSP